MWLSLAVSLACGPIPGGSLSGHLAPPPPAWGSVFDGDHGLCEIESRPADPHSIQLECFVRDGTLYVQSHRWALADWWPESWAEVWLAEPDVRVRVGESLYDLRAERVTDAALRDAILKERGYDPVPAGIAVFAFVPRAEVSQ